MRIVHTCLRYPPATGGVEHYVEQLVERTRDVDAGRDVRVLTSTMRTHGPITELAPETLLDNPPYVQRLHHTATPFISYPRLQALPYYLQHHAPDVIHGHSFWYQPADVAARYARRHGIPFIFHPYYYENTTRHKPWWQVYKRTIGATTFRAADVVVVISDFERQLIEQSGFEVRRFERLSPGVDMASFTPRRGNPFAERGITGHILLTVSRISDGKGLSDLITVLPKLLTSISDAQLVVVGEDFGAQQDLQQQAVQLGVQSQVHFLGKLTADELIGAYQHASVFVHPTHYEAFGIVLIEAMAAGLPVVARRVAAVPEVVADKITGLLFNDQEELVSQLQILLTDAERRKSLGAAGLQRVQKQFTWDATVKKLTELYKELGQ